MAGDDGRCGVAVAVVLRAGRQNNQDFSAKITKISVRYGRRYARFLLRLPPCTWPGYLGSFKKDTETKKEKADEQQPGNQESRHELHDQ